MTRFLLFPALCLLCAVRSPAGEILTLDVPPGPGERFQKAEFFCWLPETEAPIRAVIIHQHGCTNASPEKHPPVTGDFHWQALARKHNCALLSPQYFVKGNCSEWNDPASGSERAMFTALNDFAQRSGHPEIAEATWVLWGHSGGSSWSSEMIVRHPGRVLAASFRGGCSKQFGDPEFRARFVPIARDVPLLFVWGKRESVPASSHFVSWNPMNAMFSELRSRGGKVTRLIDPNSEHGCDNSRLVVIPFFDAVLTEKALPGTLADMVTMETSETTPDSIRDPALVWLPTTEVAGLWQEFSRTGQLPPFESPKIAPDLQASRDAEGKVQLSWKVAPELIGGLRAFRLRRDGKLWKEIGLTPDTPVATSRDATPETLRQTTLTDDSKGPHTYALTFLDAAGKESPPGMVEITEGE